MTPKSHILTKYDNERECSYELPTFALKILGCNSRQSRISDKCHLSHLQPMTSLTWKYLTPGLLAVSGIYSQNDIERLREHIMFPAEKLALLNSVARGITGHSFNFDGISMYNLLNKASLNKIVDNTASRIWNGFVTYGSATAGVFGMFLIIRLIKTIIDRQFTVTLYTLLTAAACICWEPYGELSHICCCISPTKGK